MNYLAHHVIALRQAADLPADFYVGNVLPDLVATSGQGRLRPHQALSSDDALCRGIALHFETDRRFHGAAAFAQAQSEAKKLLHDLSFIVPPRRWFFLIHAAVEIGLDGHLLNACPSIADDFYGRFAQSDLEAVLDKTAEMLRLDGPPLALARTIDRFVESRYLRHYADADGRAEALIRLCRRIGIEDFGGERSDQALLSSFFCALEPVIRRIEPDLMLYDQDAALATAAPVSFP